jgi:hypothetical protein
MRMLNFLYDQSINVKYELCSICLERIFEEKYVLICDHTYHKACIDRWFKKENSCPLCRCKLNSSFSDFLKSCNITIYIPPFFIVNLQLKLLVVFIYIIKMFYNNNINYSYLYIICMCILISITDNYFLIFFTESYIHYLFLKKEESIINFGYSFFSDYIIYCIATIIFYINFNIHLEHLDISEYNYNGEIIVSELD